MAAIIQMWPHANIDPSDPAGVWAGAVGDLSAEQIRHGIFLMARTPREFAINPAQFRALAVAYRTPAPRRPTAIADDSERSRAWAACQKAFATVLHGPGFEMPGTATDFPVDMVLEDVPVDRERRKRCIDAGNVACREFDDDLFARLRTAFDRRWAEYVGETRHVDAGRSGHQSVGGA